MVTTHETASGPTYEDGPGEPESPHIRDAQRSGARATVRVALGLLALAMLAAACGSSAGSGSGLNRKNKVPAGNAAEVLTARNLNLTLGDLPGGWKQEPPVKGPNVVREAINSCLATAHGASRVAATAASPEFIDLDDGQEIGSQVQVYETPAEATAAATAAGKQTLSSCIQATVTADLPKSLPSGEKLNRTSVAADTVPSRTSDEFSQRVLTDVTFPTGNGGVGGSAVYTDVLGFPSGSSLVEAEFESTGSVPTEAVERQVLTALASRAAGNAGNAAP